MAEKQCPLYRADCVEHACRWYIQILGKNPQTDAPLPNDGFGCAVEWLPILVIENAKEVRQTAAAVESARNEARKDAASIGAGLVEVAQAALAASQTIPGRLLEVRAEPPRVPLLKRFLRLGG